ncbi:MAG TPA: hypothetical protein VFQ80_09930 [Thermomicrobiales bacterium]|jgi:hypothetical protein|nr:hypothetical protein [Thermomicrobiales bacterium]
MRWLMLAGVALAGFGPAAATLAQETPTASAPLPACTIAPRPIDATLAFWFGPKATPNGTPIGTPNATPNATPVATPLPTAPLAAAAIPAGPPVDAATQAAVEATLREVVACGNAGDFTRRLALFTDRFARQLGPPPGVTAEAARAALATPQPIAAAQAASIVAIGQGRQVADGRVAALLTLDDPTARPRRQQIEAILQRSDGRWLVDDLVPIVTPATPIATPIVPASPATGG